MSSPRTRDAKRALGMVPQDIALHDDLLATDNLHMKRRLNFACGVVPQLKVVLLDEPTVGVDPQSRVRLLELVRGLVKDGACVLYTTQYMEEAETLCDRLAIIEHGRIIAQGTLDELRGMSKERDLLRLTGSFPDPGVRDVVARSSRSPDSGCGAGPDHPLRSPGHRAPSDVVHAIASAGGDVRGTTLTQPSLESLSIKLAGKELRE